jgi:hypothetical protein
MLAEPGDNDFYNLQNEEIMPGDTKGACARTYPTGKIISGGCMCVDGDDTIRYQAEFTIDIGVRAVYYHPRITREEDIRESAAHERVHIDRLRQFHAEVSRIASEYSSVQHDIPELCESAIRNCYDRVRAAFEVYKREDGRIDAFGEALRCARLKRDYGIDAALHDVSDVDKSHWDTGVFMPRRENWSYRVSAASSASNDKLVFRLRGISLADLYGPSGPGTLADFVSDDSVRVLGVSLINGTNRYAFSEFFQIRQGATTFIKDLTFTDTPPRQAERLEILAPSRTLRVGATNQLRVIAHYADGTTNDVTRKADWTSYRISNPALATLTPDGALIPKAPGLVYITAMNESATSVLSILVEEISDRVTINGRVLQPDGSAATDARIALSIPSLEAFSDLDGNFVLTAAATSTNLVRLLIVQTNLPGGWLLGDHEIQFGQAGFINLGEIVLRQVIIQRGSLQAARYRASSGPKVVDLLYDDRFEVRPDSTVSLNAAEFVDNSAAEYGTAVQGVVIPSMTGYHRFYVASDDQGWLALSESHRPELRRRIAFEPEWNPFRDWLGTARRPRRENRSEPVYLVGGFPYFMEVLHKQGVFGAGHVSIAWLQPDRETLAPDSSPIGQQFLGRFPSTDLEGGKPRILIEESGQKRVFEAGNATISLHVAGQKPLFFQWHLNGEIITGATNRVLRLGNISTNSQGRYSCIVSNVLGQAVTGEVSPLDIAVQGLSVLRGPVTNFVTGHRYYLLNASSWLSAEHAAQRLGGHLVTINDAAENSWIINQFGGRNLWIGMFDDDPTMDSRVLAQRRLEFKWASDQSPAYSNWSASEPDNYFGVQESFCAILHWSFGVTSWHSISEDGNRGSFSVHGVVEVE